MLAQRDNDRTPGANISLKAELLYKCSNAIAGDILVKRVIERVLLPAIGQSLRGNLRFADRFEALFKSPESFGHIDPSIVSKLARITRLVFVPIVIGWLREIVEEETCEQKITLSPEQINGKYGQSFIDERIADELNELAAMNLGLGDTKLLMWDASIECDTHRINECIDEVFEFLFRSQANLVAAYDCDVLVVSGKTSELPRIRHLLDREIPLPSNRIISTLNFEAGDWYPIGALNGRIKDAKSTTVVGTALYQAIQCGRVHNWHIETSNMAMHSRANYWGVMADPQNHQLFEKSIFLEPSQRRARCQLMVNSPIGRKRFRSRTVPPDQIYIFRWKSGHGTEPVLVTAEFERVLHPNRGEALKLVNAQAQSKDGTRYSAESFELTLCTLPNGVFWMDQPRFEVEW